MKTTMRSDRRKNPESVEYELLTFEECKKLASESHCNVLDQNGRIAQVKITSVKTWKTRPDELLIGYKFGLYEYGKVSIFRHPNGTCDNKFYVRLVTHDEPEPTQEDSDNIVTCPTCDGYAYSMGSLGALKWYRCRSCGTQFHK